MVDFNWQFLRDLLRLEGDETFADQAGVARAAQAPEPAGIALWGWRCGSVVSRGRPPLVRRNAEVAPTVGVLLPNRKISETAVDAQASA